MQVHILRQSNNENIRILCDINRGSKHIKSYRHSESKVLNVSFLLPDNINLPYVFNMDLYCLENSYFKKSNGKK